MEPAVIEIVINAALQTAAGILLAVFIRQLWDGTLEGADECGRWK